MGDCKGLQGVTNIESLAYAILPVLLVANVFTIVRDKRCYVRFKSLDTTRERQAMFRRWLVESFLMHGVISVVCLLALGHLAALMELPDFMQQLSNSLYGLRDSEGQDSFVGGFFRGLSLSLIPVLLFGNTFVSLARTYSEHRKAEDERVDAFESRDIAHLFPRNRDERFWTALLSVNAGLSEELFFRLLAPLLFYLVTGDPFVSVLAATLWFGLAHYYQGWAGVALTALAGAILMLVYLYTGSIWLVILIHAVWDLNDLALSPWFSDWLKRREAPR